MSSLSIGRSLSGLILVLACALFLAGAEEAKADHYDVRVEKPNNLALVRVKVSLQNQAVYVLEGDRPLLVSAICVGKADHPTPTGAFRVNDKIEKKRSGEYGFWGSGDRWTSGESGRSPHSGWHYVGYPMPDWIEFSPGYGFHAGYVWPEPRTHGCLRVPQRVAPKLFSLVRVGTPISIARTQPEDSTLGRHLKRPTDYRDPDPPAARMASDAAFRL